MTIPLPSVPDENRSANQTDLAFCSPLPALSASSALQSLQHQLEKAHALNETSRLILESAGEGIYGLDAQGRTTFANPATERMTGWKPAEMLGRSQHRLVHHSHANGDPYNREDCPIYAALRDGLTHHTDSEVFWRKDGTSFPVSYTSTPILRDGKPVGAVVLFSDISKKKRSEAWEKEKVNIFRAITSHQALDRVLGMIADIYVACYPSQAIALHLRSGHVLQLLAKAGLPATLSKSLTDIQLGGSTDFEASLCAKAAQWARDVIAQRNTVSFIELTSPAFGHCSVLPLVSDTGEVLGTVSVWRKDDAPCSFEAEEHLRNACHMARLAIEHRRLNEELRHQSQHDALTGLPNRLLLHDRLEQVILQAKRRGSMVGVGYLDLDRFKHVNDTLGHAAGDELLRHLSGVLVRSLRDFDSVARQGGDEFIIVLPDLSSPDEAQEICRRLLSDLGQVVRVSGSDLKPAASIGMSLYPDHGTSATELLKCADVALYQAKREGKGRVKILNTSLDQENQLNSEIQTALPFALDRNELSLVYQPLFHADSTLVSFEALLRWNHPTLGSVSPDRFIPIAEESRLITGIGEWVLERACEQAMAWNAVAPAPIKMQVNVSGVQLAEANFPLAVAAILKKTGLAPHLLDLEITETWYVDATRSHAQLQTIRDLGIGVSIDDFGSGHASFGYLQDLPADTVKIDRSFIARLDGTARGSATVQTIIALAARLGLNVVAEGVETESQREELLRAGCSLMQGYLFAKPLAPDAAHALVIAMQKPRHAGCPTSRF